MSVIAQLPANTHNTPLHLSCSTIPCATGFTVRECHPIETFAARTLNPKHNGAYAHLELLSYRTQASPRSDRLDHLPTPSFNRTFLAMTKLIRNDTTVHQVFSER